MIHNIRTEFINILDESDWMDNQTKTVAKEKVSKSLWFKPDFQYL